MNKIKMYKKEFILVLIALIILVFVLLLSKYKAESDAEPSVINTDIQLSPEEYRNPSARARMEKISPRAAQLEIYSEFPEHFPSTLYEGKLFHLVAFPDSYGFETPNFAEGRNKDRPGVIVFEGNNIIWENSDDFMEIFTFLTVFRDVTGDGVSEVIVVDSGGGNVTYCITTIYIWNGQTFALITPEPHEGISLCSGVNDDEGIQDIDEDGVFELVAYLKRKVHPEIHDIDNPLYLEEKTVRQIYKYNGTKYFLWKEEVVPIEE